MSVYFVCAVVLKLWDTDDMAVWSVHADLNRQPADLQAALDKTEHYCAMIGLTLSAVKITVMSITINGAEFTFLEPFC